MGSNLIVSFIHLFPAAIVEYVAHERYSNSANTSSHHMIGNVNVTYVEEIHVLWLVPQFAFLGISEVFVGLAGTQLFYHLVTLGLYTVNWDYFVVGRFIPERTWYHVSKWDASLMD